MLFGFFFFQAEDGIRDLVRSRGLGDVYKRQNQTVAKIPIVAMTAYAMTEHRQSCIKSGMNDYITKPVNMSDLYTIIERNLSKR